MSDRPSIEIYSIGTELLNGQIQDTNSFWMAQQIAALGGYVRRIAILDDDMAELTGVLTDACTRGTRVVITTGGLGPTPDDMTVEAIAQIMGVQTEIDESLVARYMESRNIATREDVNPGLVKMATKPVGAWAHPNPAGVAPCVESQIGDTTIFSLPGPPREVEALFRQSVEDRLAEIYDDLDAVAASHPMGRIGEPADFGRIVAFLCSETANYVNGTGLPVEGGSLLES